MQLAKGYSTGDTGVHLWEINGEEHRVLFSNLQEHLRALSGSSKATK